MVALVDVTFVTCTLEMSARVLKVLVEESTGVELPAGVDSAKKL
jgi:hypothetical protein